MENDDINEVKSKIPIDETKSGITLAVRRYHSQNKVDWESGHREIFERDDPYYELLNNYLKYDNAKEKYQEHAI